MKTFATNKQWAVKKGWLLAGAGLLAAALAGAQTLTISTVAGYAGKGSADGVGGSALFFNAQGVAVDGAGNVYVADTGNNTIRVVTAAGVSGTLAGKAGVSGSGDGTGPNALFNQPTGMALDSATNIYVTDYGNNTIREVTPLGAVTTIAGTAGVAGSVNNTGTNALFYHPLGIAVDSASNVYVADYGNELIRKITPGRVVSTLAGSAGVFGTNNGTGTGAQFYNPEGVAVDHAGNVYVADTGNAEIRMITPGGVVSTLAGAPGFLGGTDGTGSNALFYQPAGLCINSVSNIYVADYFNNTLRQVSTGGVVITLAGLAGTAGSADGANSSARFLAPQGMAVGGSGTVYIADSGNSTIRQMTPAGVVSTLAGSSSVGSSNGVTTSARLYSPQNVAADSSGDVYVADTQNSVIRKITPAGVVSVLAGSVGVFGSAEGTGPGVLFSGPQGVAVDSSGNIYVADTGNSTIRKLTTGGTSSTLAGLAGNPGNADGTGTGAQFNNPEGVAVDSGNNVYVADTWNHTIRKITSGGVSSTLAGEAGVFGSFDGTNAQARFNNPTGVAVDGSGNLYVTDYNNDTIRKVTAAGVVSTLAGLAGSWGYVDGTNSTALFNGPAGIAVDGSGNLYVVDSGNSVLRKITPSGGWVVTTVAGLAGVSGSSNGPGTAAEFYSPAGITLNSAGYFFVADSGNNTIRTTKTVAVLTWANPTGITYGTALGGAQLNANASVLGSFTYTPPGGTVLNTGTNTLSVSFAPNNTTDYAGASGTVSEVVSPASLTVTAANASRPYDTANPAFSGVITGVQNGDNITASYNTTATLLSPVGGYPITPSLVDPNDRQTNYTVTLNNGTLTVLAQPGNFQSTVAQPDGTLQFGFSGTPGATYTLDVSTDLMTWTPLVTFVMTNGAVQYNDATAPNFPTRFYLLVSP